MNWQEEIEEQYKETLDIAQQYAVLYKKAKEKFPYRINVIQELHDNENAHSRILIGLLKYADCGKFTWLCSFINRMNEYCEGSFSFEVSKPIINTEVHTGDGRIDGLIMEKRKYAIIIENKIWDAVDQDKQIDKYVSFINEKCHVALENIFVIYLTKNGSKIISESSLSKGTKENMGNLLIPMSFQYDILPWLEEDLLPNCKMKEKCMESAIYQYIDYLKGVFGLLDYQKEAQKIALKQILKKMDVTENISEIVKKYKDVQALATALGNKLNDLGKQNLQVFHKITQDFFWNKEGFDFKDRTSDEYSNGYYQICDKQWETIPDLYPHFEWVPLLYFNLLDSEGLTLVLHIEGNSEKIESCAKILIDKARNLKYIERYNKNTFFKREYFLNGKSFASMSEEEKRTFLNEIYASETIQTIIELMYETITEMKQQKENK